MLDKNKKQAAKRKVRVKTTIDHKSVPHSVDIHSLIPAKPYLNFKNKNAFIVIPGESQPDPHRTVLMKGPNEGYDKTTLFHEICSVTYAYPGNN